MVSTYIVRYFNNHQFSWMAIMCVRTHETVVAPNPRVYNEWIWIYEYTVFECVLQLNNL